MLTLGIIPGYSSSFAHGINDDGQVVGDACTRSNRFPHAFLYSGGLMMDLNNLIATNSGWTLQEATAINNDGEIVGNAYARGDKFPHAFLYSNGSMLTLGIIPGYSSSFAHGINDDGQVVGSACTRVNKWPHAFLYSGGSMMDLNNLIATNSGWTLEVATAINDNGQIVGEGIDPSGKREAFLLTPDPVPEPATWSLLALGIGVLLGGRKFHRRLLPG
jgi:probable HAF family extracellular repeat protein